MLAAPKDFLQRIVRKQNVCEIQFVCLCLPPVLALLCDQQPEKVYIYIYIYIHKELGPEVPTCVKCVCVCQNCMCVNIHACVLSFSTPTTRNSWEMWVCGSCPKRRSSPRRRSHSSDRPRGHLAGLHSENRKGNASAAHGNNRPQTCRSEASRHEIGHVGPQLMQATRSAQTRH